MMYKDTIIPLQERIHKIQYQYIDINIEKLNVKKFSGAVNQPTLKYYLNPLFPYNQGYL